MGSTWRLQRIRKELLLDLINQHHLTIDDIVDRYATSKTKLYEYFRDTYQDTPGKWRKRYWRGVHYAARFYTTAFKVSVCDEFEDQRIDDDCYIDPPYHEEDVPMTYRVAHVVATIEGQVRTFKTNRTLQQDRWENIHATDNSHTLSVRLTRGGRHPTITAFLSMGSHLGGQLKRSYTLDVSIVVDMVGYDNSVLGPSPKELPIPEEAVMSPIGEGAEFDLSERSVYLLPIGSQVLLLGLNESVEDHVNKLHPRWRRVTLNNTLRTKLRMAFHTGQYISVHLKEAIEMQGRIMTLMDRWKGVAVCWFLIEQRRYLVVLEDEIDLSDLIAHYRYMDGKPTWVNRDDIERIAQQHQAPVVTLADLSLTLRQALLA